MGRPTSARIDEDMYTDLHGVYADTMDLQDAEKPSAASHAPHTAHNGLAPHQAASLHHVAEERHSEERSLADAWNASATNDDAAETHEISVHEHDDQVAVADGNNRELDDGEMVDSDGDMDDDMADRISSSPSIDDGTLNLLDSSPLYHPFWPPRSSSREAQTPPSSPTSTDFISPVFHIHEQISQKKAVTRDEASEVYFPSTSKHHHPLGRYVDSGPGFEDQGNDNYWDYAEDVPTRWQSFAPLDVIESDSETLAIPSSESQGIELDAGQTLHLRSLMDRPLPPLPESPSLASIGSMSLSNFLLPIDDPFLDGPPSPNESLSSRETVSSESDAYDRDAYTTNDLDTIDDDANDNFFELRSRFVESGCSDVYLHRTEDIDFDLVYALHTFVATVEGQANATKGDTMVLLDDTNSYWWLVRVVKDNSIGYLPAEHIETPTERLARLNKHRNIDLSATMLGDQSEKSRNPLKMAIRRRNAKTVQFAPPTYVEASDYEYSDEEGEESNITNPYADMDQNSKEQQEGTHEGESEEESGQRAAVEAKTPTHIKRNSFDREQAAMAAAAAAEGRSADDEPPISSMLVDKTEAAPLKGRTKNSTRDSFLKDDNLETRKITLTPGLLREDSASIKSGSTESSRGPSMEMLVKQISPAENSPRKDGKDKKKEGKKGGMLSGLFKSKKKDKKAKEEAAEQAEARKASNESSRNESPKPSSVTSIDNSPIDKTASIESSVDTRQPAPQMRLQQQNAQDVNATSIPISGTSFLAELPGSEVAHEMATPGEERDGALAPITNILRSASSGGNVEKPKKAKRSKRRFELDDFDSPAVERNDPLEKSCESTYMHGTELIHIPVMGEGQEDEYDDDTADTDEDDEEPRKVNTLPSSLLGPTSSESESIHRIITPDSQTSVTPQSTLQPHHTALSNDRRSLVSPADESFLEPDSDATPIASRSPQLPGSYPISEPSSSTSNLTTPRALSPLSQSYDHGPVSPLYEPHSLSSALNTPSSPTVPRSLPSPTAPTNTLSSEQGGLHANENNARTPSPLDTTRATLQARSNSTPSLTTTPISTNTPITASSNTNAQPWSDAQLRAWLDDGSEVRDLLTLVRGAGGGNGANGNQAKNASVPAVSPDHPLMKGLFVEPRKGVTDMMGQLDVLLSEFLGRRGVVLG
ncbi:Hypothetical protein R9X50_00471000 [Acrodontium crateriforme]|uniref:SH3 domain-containing protein n=1 Tax=Acrodontium crateriforme TaxID=150365 RepID=A0AAQ3M8E5_9PEZI|nr:Hypothetical protein R9X50_00471000 [Acrodontium crateriforme]